MGATIRRLDVFCQAGSVEKKTVDLLADPEIQRHTRRILELQKAERQTREELGGIIAAIGAELLAVKEALDRLADKTAWLRWLKAHVHYSADTAQNYMRVARFSEKNRSASVFFSLDPSLLYRIAALPDEMAAGLTPDTPLTDPRTGRQAALKDLSTRALDRALDALEGRTAAAAAKPAAAPAGDTAFAGATREEFAADALRAMDTLSDRLAGIRGRKGRLTGDSKQRVLAAIEQLRRIVLKWPAWATPAAGRRRRKSAAAR
jgi:hypothetical protein